MVVVTHDGDGKIYADGVFLFEVLISDGDEVARRVNGLIRAAQSAEVLPDTAQQAQPATPDNGAHSYTEAQQA